MRSRNFGGVKGIWRNPDLTGFSLMMASLKYKRSNIFAEQEVCKLYQKVILICSTNGNGGKLFSSSIQSLRFPQSGTDCILHPYVCVYIFNI